MKKYLVLLMAALFVMTVSLPAMAMTFDLSPFENSENYEVEFDEMDDTGEIKLVEGGTVLGLMSEDEGLLIGEVDIKIVEGVPPVIRLSFLYMGEDWIFTDKVIIKPAETRYTFEVDRDTDVEDGKVYEMYTLVMTDESIQMLQDIVDNDVLLVKCRLAGDRDVDGSLMFDNDKLGILLNDYRASGALENSFEEIKAMFPCTIK